MLKKVELLLVFIFLIHLTSTNYYLYAQSPYQNVHINYKNNLLTISAKDVDLKNVLSKLSDETNIYVHFPVSLKKTITIDKSNISLREAFESLLVELNCLILYSGPSRNQSTISEVFVLPKSTKSRRQSGNERHIANRIRAYKKRIESLTKRLQNIDENSRRGKRYLTQIRQLERNIERQLY